MVDITIIMPLYNAEKYLEECLDSILAQSFENFELICINDASIDNTINILEKYSKKDARIKILNNKNRIGAALSRNRALKEVEGMYLTFLDGDDIFDENMLYIEYQTAIRYNADIVECQYKFVSNEQVFTKTQIHHSVNYRERLCMKTFKISDLEPYEFMNLHNAPWNKLYRSEFIQSEKIEFQNLSDCNDVFFVNMALMLASRIIVVDDPRVMVYVRQHNTPSRISTDRNPMNIYLADMKIAEVLNSKGKMEKLYKHFYYRVFCHWIETLKNIKNEELAKKFYIFLEKEGIENLSIAGKEFYYLLDKEIIKKFETFKRKKFETEWYKKEGEFLLYIASNQEKIRQLFKLWKKEQLKIGIWGTGRNGRIFLDYCKENNYYIDIVMDSDQSKWGKSFSGFSKVQNPKEGINKVQILIITSSNLVEEISEIIQELKLKIQIYDINLYIGR